LGKAHGAPSDRVIQTEFRSSNSGLRFALSSVIHRLRHEVPSPDAVRSVEPVVSRAAAERRVQREIDRVLGIAGHEQPSIALAADIGPISSGAVDPQQRFRDLEDGIHALIPGATASHPLWDEQRIG
jgi:hypothetical protein